MGIEFIDGASSSGSGTVGGTGTLNQIAVWSSSTDITGTAELARTTTQVQFVVSSAGNTVGHVAQNTENANAASHAFFYASSGGTSGGDAFYRAGVSGSTQWSFGVDNSDSDAFCLTNSSTLNGTNLFRMGTDSAVVLGNLTLSALSSNKITLATPSAATTGTTVEVQSGANTTASAAGGSFIIRGGAGGAGGERGTIFIGSTANTAGNRGCFCSETDATGYLGYDYAGGAYKRFSAAYFSTDLKVGATTNTEIGVDIGKGSAGGYIAFTRSTTGTGMSIQTEYSKALTINQPSADGGSPMFSFGDWGDATKYGRFLFLKSTEADLLWYTDGAGSIGGSTSTKRPDNVYVKTGIYKSTYRIDPFEYSAGNSGTALTVNWSDGSLQSVTLTGNVTFTLSNPVTGGVYALRILTGAGGFTATWPATVKWPSGTAPTITATASRMDLINLLWDGTNYYGSFTQDYTP